MKKLILIMLSLCLGSSVYAEALAVSSAFDLEELEDEMSLNVGLSSGDVDLYGVKINIPVGDNFLVFGDAALVDLDYDDDEFAFGGGALLKLGLDSPFPVGVKGSYHIVSGDNWDSTEIAVRAVASGEFADVDGLKWFAEAGIHFLETEFDLGIYGDADADETELGLEGGLQYRFSDELAGFASFEVIDDSWVNLGVRWLFGN